MWVLCHEKVDVQNAVCGQVVVIPGRFVRPSVWFHCCYLLSIVISNQDGHTVCPGWTIGLSILNAGALCYNCVDKLYVHLILVPGHFKVWTKNWLDILMSGP